MSNTAVGSLYNSIIEEVINSSRVDFEEGGVDESALDSLRQGWQQRLTGLQVASFPWDPAPEPLPEVAAPAAAAPTQPAPSSQPAQTDLYASASQPSGLSLPVLPNGGPGNGIKLEPGTEPQAQIKDEPGMQGRGAQLAAERLKQQYGDEAQNSINAIQSGIPSSSNVPPKPEAHAPQLPQIQSYGHPNIPQHDGADDDMSAFGGVIMARDEYGRLQELGTVAIDNWMHRQLAASAKRMEGGGLMVPLKEATKTTAMAPRVKASRTPAPFDGGYDEDDEDAINSDLDDPDDDANEDEEEEEGLANIMLCMYDKVQRVKNKWKCTLKDGVLAINGKEYIFHKATGEFEW